MAISCDNPYSANELQQCLATISWPATEDVQALTHPPYNFWLYGLFSYLPFTSSLLLWSIVSAGLCAWSGLQWWKMRGIALNAGAIPTTLVILTFPPITSNLLWGQVNAVHFFGLTAFTILYNRHRPLLAGILLSLTLAKPNLYLCTYAYLLLVTIRQRAWGVCLGGTLGLAAQIFISQLLYPRGWQLYYERLHSLAGEAVTLAGATLAQQLAILTGWNFVPIVFMACALLAGITAGIRERMQLSLLPLTLCLSLICAPYCWSHGLIACFPIFITPIARFCQRLSERQILFSILVLVCASQSLIVISQTQIIWMMIPFFALACWILEKNKASSNNMYQHTTTESSA